MARSPLPRAFPALANSTFVVFWLGMLPSMMAWQMGVVATPYAAFSLTGSATVLGIVSFSTGLPMMLLSPIGGVVADRLPRRRVLIMTQATLGLAIGVLAILALAGVLEIWHLLALGFVQGIAFSFNMPARQAYLADLVGQQLLRNAIAINNAGMNFTRVVGPALAGAMLAIPGFGVGGVYVGMTAMYGIVLASLLRLPSDTAARSTSADGPRRPRKPSPLEQLQEGMRYIRSSPTLLTLLGTAFLVLFLGFPFQTLMPVFAERVFAVGPSGLGAMMAAIGLGALAGSLTVAGLSSFPRPARLQIACGVGFGLALVALGFAPSFLVAVAVLACVGFLSSAYSSLNNTLVMANTDPRFYGRVMSIYLITFATMPLGSMPTAWLADQIGAPSTVVLTGLLVTLAIAGLALAHPAYRRIE